MEAMLLKMHSGRSYRNFLRLPGVKLVTSSSPSPLANTEGVAAAATGKIVIAPAAIDNTAVISQRSGRRRSPLLGSA